MVPILQENGTKFSDQTGPAKRVRHKSREARAVNRFVKNRAANFGRTGPT